MTSNFNEQYLKVLDKKNLIGNFMDFDLKVKKAEFVPESDITNTLLSNGLIKIDDNRLDHDTNLPVTKYRYKEGGDKLADKANNFLYSKGEKETTKNSKPQLVDILFNEIISEGLVKSFEKMYLNIKSEVPTPNTSFINYLLKYDIIQKRNVAFASVAEGEHYELTDLGSQLVHMMIENGWSQSRRK